MLEVRFHGRGGQGAVTSATILATAAIARGQYAQAFPAFGPERRGAPVLAFVRLSSEPIRNRSAIQRPDVVLVLEPSLLRLVKVDAGLKPGGTLILNSSKDAALIRKELGYTCRLVTVDANTIAREEIGRVITNTVMLGAFVKATEVVDAGGIIEQIHEALGPIAPKNVKAFERAIREAKIDEAKQVAA
jgi:pyruvate ferredoxin oxidoreductase gamma subunit